MADASINLLIAFGSIGLFLIGMTILTEGLRGIAGDSLRRWLARFTTTPASGIATGAITTAIAQSSSATTIAAVGFVGAGLLTFPQALGIIFGANIGTTITGWIVAILGFKLQLGLIVQPLILVGVLLRMFGTGRLQHVGWALAGFGLLFVAIYSMKLAMAPYQGIITPEILPNDSWLGRIQLVFIGMVITVITQSSSAGVAIALVSLSTGAIALPQAAAMVIGMDIGTTFTAALATVGGGSATRRTGYAHVIYNILTAIMALLLLDIFGVLAEAWRSVGDMDEQIALVAFHSTFNILGAIVALPFMHVFAGLIVHLVPERGPRFLRRLDDRLLAEPAIAVEAITTTVRDLTTASLCVLDQRLGSGNRLPIEPVTTAQLDNALAGLRRFIGQIRTDPTQQASHQRHIAAVHILDHLLRLNHRFKQQARIDVMQTDARLLRLARLLHETSLMLDQADVAQTERRLDRVRRLMRRQRTLFRKKTVETTSVRGVSPEVTLGKLDAARWLQRVAHHYWRIAHHLRVFADSRSPPGTADANHLATTSHDRPT